MLLTSSKSTHPCLFPPFVAHDLFWSHDLVRTFVLQEMQSTRDPSKVGNTSILQSRQDDVNLSTAGHRLLPVRSTRCWSRVVRLKLLHAGRNNERSQAESSRHSGDRMTARRTCTLVTPAGGPQPHKTSNFRQPCVRTDRHAACSRQTRHTDWRNFGEGRAGGPRRSGRTSRGGRRASDRGSHPDTGSIPPAWLLTHPGYLVESSRLRNRRLRNFKARG